MIRFLSYILDANTPTYGNRNKFFIEKKSDISKGDVANDTSINTTVHIGTHIDMPRHFFEEGQTIEDFKEDFWIFNNVLYIDIKPNNVIIKDEIINKLDKIEDIGYEILIVKTGICNIRQEEEFWSHNYGFHPDLYDYLVERFPKIRVLGFDSISVSSFTNRMLGRESHKRFLNPNKPILLLEDMNLIDFSESISLNKLIIAPLRISKSDGLPCTIIGFSDD